MSFRFKTVAPQFRSIRGFCSPNEQKVLGHASKFGSVGFEKLKIALPLFTDQPMVGARSVDAAYPLRVHARNRPPSFPENSHQKGTNAARFR
jgi:hypothetical protein